MMNHVGFHEQWIGFRHTRHTPGPALAICSPISKSFDTGLPGNTLDNCDTVLLTVFTNLFNTSIARETAENIENQTKRTNNIQGIQHTQFYWILMF